MSRNTFLYIFICAIVSCMSACDKNAHEKRVVRDKRTLDFR